MCRRGHCEVATGDWQRKDTDERDEWKPVERFHGVEKRGSEEDSLNQFFVKVRFSFEEDFKG